MKQINWYMIAKILSKYWLRQKKSINKKSIHQINPIFHFIKKSRILSTLRLLDRQINCYKYSPSHEVNTEVYVSAKIINVF